MGWSRARQAWLIVFIAVAFTPAVLRAVSPERQLLGPELITITGLLALVLLVATIVLPSRLRSLTRAFGIESVLRSHRYLGFSTALVTLAHVAAVLANDPRGVGLLLPFVDRLAPADTITRVPLLYPFLTPPSRALAGVAATTGLVALAALSGRRTGSWERWRIWHLVAVAATVIGTVWHVVAIGHLIPTVALVQLLRSDPLAMTLIDAAPVDQASTLFLVGLFAALVVVVARRWFNRTAAYRVLGVNRVSSQVSTLGLAPVRRGLRRQRPGQFVWLRMHPSPLMGEEHPFTVSSPVQDHPTLEITFRHTGDWTHRLRLLQPGETVWLNGPHGSFTPSVKSQGLVLIAGGVGITPIMAVLRSAARGQKYRPRCPILLIRTDRPGRGLFAKEIVGLVAQLDLQHVELEGARLTFELLDAQLPRGHEQLDYYVCGPPGLIHDTGAVLAALNVPPYRIHTELFDA